jgi:hypothetical protein
MAGRTGCGDGGFVHHCAGRGMCSYGSLLRRTHRNLTSRPGPGNLDRAPRSIVGTVLFKERQHMFGTIGRPIRQETVIGDVKRATAMDGNETPVAHGWFSLA